MSLHFPILQITAHKDVQLNPAIPDPRITEIRQLRMLNHGPFKSFLFIFYIGNKENPPITDEISWSLDFRYCEWQLYTVKSRYGASAYTKILPKDKEYKY